MALRYGHSSDINLNEVQFQGSVLTVAIVTWWELLKRQGPMSLVMLEMIWCSS